MRSTLTDIAREAGVSPATVDRVLNNRAGVRARTREVVLETAQRLGYIAENSNSPVPRTALPGDVIRLSDLPMPTGVTANGDPEMPIVTILIMSASELESDAVPAEEAAEE